MASQTPWREFEDDVAQIMGGERVPGSGNRWFAKMDVSSPGVLWSLKYTKHRSFSLSQADLDELRSAVYGPDGVGSGTIPAMAVRLGDRTYDMVILPMEEFMRMFAEGVKVGVVSKAEQKRRRANTPELLREDST